MYHRTGALPSVRTGGGSRVFVPRLSRGNDRLGHRAPAGNERACALLVILVQAAGDRARHRIRGAAGSGPRCRGAPVCVPMAQQNIMRHTATVDRRGADPDVPPLARVILHAANLAAAVPELNGLIDLVTSDPPYIPDGTGLEPEAVGTIRRLRSGEDAMASR